MRTTESLMTECVILTALQEHGLTQVRAQRKRLRKQLRRRKRNMLKGETQEQVGGTE